MKERPILFSGPMVRRILDGSKTNTRRLKGLDVVNENPDDWTFSGIAADGYAVFWSKKVRGVYTRIKSPYGQTGDSLWIRERMRVTAIDINGRISVEYEADEARSKWLEYPERLKGKPQLRKCLSYGGYREASRISLEITDVRVERLHDISEADAKAEGIQLISGEPMYADEPIERYSAKAQFQSLWDKINGKKHSWSSNPWVWVLKFKKVTEL